MISLDLETESKRKAKPLKKCAAFYKPWGFVQCKIQGKRFVSISVDYLNYKYFYIIWWIETG